MSRQTYKLISDSVRDHIIRQVRVAPWGKVITIADPKRTDEQNAKLHAMFADVANQCEFAGKKWEAEDWKRLLVDAFYRATKDDPEYKRDWVRANHRVVPNLDGSGVVALGAQTRRFTRKLAAAFITFLQAWGAEQGVRWSAAEWEIN